jgi:lysophospholipase L1-like esterase
MQIVPTLAQIGSAVVTHGGNLTGHAINYIVEDLPTDTVAAIEQYGNFDFELRSKLKPDAIKIVAEGDSWFDFKPSWLQNPLKGDLLGQLNRMPEFNIYRVGKAGDTIENMIYGTDYDREYSPEPSQLERTLEAITRHQPRALLFSGGGNDIVGDELAGYLNHASSSAGAANLLRLEHVRFVFRTYIAQALRELIRQIRETRPGTPIFLHGYDYAIPTGKGVIRIPPGWTFVGPWLRPAFAAKRISLELATGIVRQLTNEFNEMQIELADSLPDVHHIDLRGTLTADDWSDELHPTPTGFGKVAERFKSAILSKVQPKSADCES